MQNLKHLSDNELTTLCITGNNRAFGIIFERYQLKVRGNILAADFDQTDADDIVQETFIKAMHAMRDGNYKESAKLGPWLCQIAKNIMMDIFRLRTRSKKGGSYCASHQYFTGYVTAPDFVLNSTILDNVYAPFTEDDHLFFQKCEKIIIYLLDFIPEDQKEVVILRYYEGYDFNEIAALKKLSINTCLGRMRYALGSLRKIISDVETLKEVTSSEMMRELLEKKAKVECPVLLLNRLV